MVKTKIQKEPQLPAALFPFKWAHPDVHLAIEDFQPGLLPAGRTSLPSGYF